MSDFFDIPFFLILFGFPLHAFSNIQSLGKVLLFFEGVRVRICSRP